MKEVNEENEEKKRKKFKSTCRYRHGIVRRYFKEMASWRFQFGSFLSTSERKSAVPSIKPSRRSDPSRAHAHAKHKRPLYRTLGHVPNDDAPGPPPISTASWIQLCWSHSRNSRTHWTCSMVRGTFPWRWSNVSWFLGSLEWSYSPRLQVYRCRSLDHRKRNDSQKRTHSMSRINRS